MSTFWILVLLAGNQSSSYIPGWNTQAECETAGKAVVFKAHQVFRLMDYICIYQNVGVK